MTFTMLPPTTTVSRALTIEEFSFPFKSMETSGSSSMTMIRLPASSKELACGATATAPVSIRAGARANGKADKSTSVSGSSILQVTPAVP